MRTSLYISPVTHPTCSIWSRGEFENEICSLHTLVKTNSAQRQLWLSLLCRRSPDFLFHKRHFLPTQFLMRCKILVLVAIFVYFYFPILLISFNHWNQCRLSQDVGTLFHAEARIWFTYGHSIQIPLIDAEGKPAFLFQGRLPWLSSIR